MPLAILALFSVGVNIPGVYSRVAARLQALAAGIWHNWLIGATNKRSLIAYGH